MRFGWLYLAASIAGSCFAAGNSVHEAVALPQTHRLQLNSLVKPGLGTIGLILKTRVDGGPPLRLLLDSGAQHLVLSRNAARKSGLQAETELDLVGAGTTLRSARAAAATVEIEEITLRDCPAVVVGGALAEGIDGVIPLSLFAGYYIRLDVPHRILELEPYPLQASESTFVRATNRGNLLFLPAGTRNGADGFMLLDTGSAYNVLSNVASAQLQAGRVSAVTAAAGKTEARVLAGRLPVQLGHGELRFDAALSLPLTEISRRHGMDVTGIIGYPALAGAVVTVNYRDSLVRIQGK